MNKISLEKISKIINSGLTPLRSNKEYWIDGNIPWVKTEQLGVKYIYDSNEKITNYALQNTSIKLNPGNTLSIAMYGEGKTRGSVSILKNETTTNQACCNIVIDEEKADFEFVYYNLKTQYSNLRNLSSGVRKNLNSRDIKNFEILLPKPSTQKQIAKVLSDLDAKIELNNKINQELEAMAKMVYDYWFVQFDFPDANGKPYKSSGGKMVFNEELKREIPEGWEVEELLSIASITTGRLDSNAEVEGGEYHFYTCATNPTKTDSYAFDDSVILIAGNNAAGNFHVNRFTGKFNAYQRTYVITTSEKKNLDYLYQVIKYQMKIYKTQGKGSQTKFLTIGMLNNIPVFKPDTNLMKVFSKMTIPMYQKQVNLKNENQKLSELRDWLLPMLMNGQITVGDKEKEIESLQMVAEPEAVYETKETSISDLFETLNFDYEVATVVWLTEQKLGMSYGKKYIHKMFSNIEFLNTLPTIKELTFQENGWGMFSPAIAKTIENKKFISFENIGYNQSVLKLNYKHLSTVGKWTKKEENLDFVSQVNTMLSVYEDSLIDKNMDRIELLNTVLECIKVLQSYDFDTVYTKMKNWKMIEDGYGTKADKFKEGETRFMIELVMRLKKEN